MFQRPDTKHEGLHLNASTILKEAGDFRCLYFSGAATIASMLELA